jgi:hypothetical protein
LFNSAKRLLIDATDLLLSSARSSPKSGIGGGGGGGGGVGGGGAKDAAIPFPLGTLTERELTLNGSNSADFRSLFQTTPVV